MSSDNQEENLTFNAACFSTNYQNLNSITIMKQYFMSTECLDIVYVKNYQVEFVHKLLGENGSKMECKNIYKEIDLSSQNNKVD